MGPEVISREQVTRACDHFAGDDKEEACAGGGAPSSSSTSATYSAATSWTSAPGSVPELRSGARWEEVVARLSDMPKYERWDGGPGTRGNPQGLQYCHCISQWPGTGKRASAYVGCIGWVLDSSPGDHGGAIPTSASWRCRGTRDQPLTTASRPCRACPGRCCGGACHTLLPSVSSHLG